MSRPQCKYHCHSDCSLKHGKDQPQLPRLLHLSLPTPPAPQLPLLPKDRVSLKSLKVKTRSVSASFSKTAAESLSAATAAMCQWHCLVLPSKRRQQGPDHVPLLAPQKKHFSSLRAAGTASVALFPAFWCPQSPSIDVPPLSLMLFHYSLAAATHHFSISLHRVAK